MEGGEIRNWLDEELEKASNPAATRRSNGFDSLKREPC
jgi:hypothetical protein